MNRSSEMETGSNLRWMAATLLVVLLQFGSAGLKGQTTAPPQPATPPAAAKTETSTQPVNGQAVTGAQTPAGTTAVPAVPPAAAGTVAPVPAAAGCAPAAAPAAASKGLGRFASKLGMPATPAPAANCTPQNNLVDAKTATPGAATSGAAKPTEATGANAAKVALMSPQQSMEASNQMLHLIWIATNLGMQAMNTIAEVFPPEKIAAFKLASEKYHTAQAGNTDHNMDALSFKAASDASAEFAKLDVDWKCYDKEKARVVPLADRKLAMMLGVDAMAGTKLPALIQGFTATISGMEQNPMQVMGARKLMSTVGVVTQVGKEMPGQVSSFKTVRGIVKKIAEAENMTLAPDPSAASLKDPVVATATATALPN